MINFQDWNIKLQKLYDVYTKFDDNTIYTKEEIVSTEQELKDIEATIGTSIPPSLRETFLNFSKKIWLLATFPETLEIPPNLKDVFSANFLISPDELLNAEDDRKSWVEGCFPNLEDPYDKVWHNKLGFMTVPNGDVIAFDLNDSKEDKRVVYLCHDGCEYHGYVLGESFSDYFSKLLLIGGCGNEGWQMEPFISNSVSGIDPDCDNAREYRKIIGLQW